MVHGRSSLVGVHCLVNSVSVCTEEEDEEEEEDEDILAAPIYIHLHVPDTYT